MPFKIDAIRFVWFVVCIFFSIFYAWSMLVFFPFLSVLNNDMKPSLPQQFQISHDLDIFKDLHFIEIQSDVNATNYWIIMSKISQKRKKLNEEINKWNSLNRRRWLTSMAKVLWCSQSNNKLLYAAMVENNELRLR